MNADDPSAGGAAPDRSGASDSVTARDRASADASAGAPATLLRIDDEHTWVAHLAAGARSGADVGQRVDIGALRIARTLFLHDPPTPAEIERAIDVVEDAVMRLPRAAGPSAALVGSGAHLRGWAAAGGARLTLETVEQWFQRLASTALGQPQAMHGLPGGRAAAATLLILREFMHHLGYTAIVVDADPP